MKSGKRDTLRIVISLVVFLGLITLVSLHRKKTYQDNEKAEQAKKLVTFDLATIDKIEVANSFGKVSFNLRPKDASGKFSDSLAKYSDEFDTISEWSVTSPYVALPDFYSMNTLVDNIKDLTSERTIDEKGEKPSDFGLDPAAITVSLFEKGKAAPKFFVKAGEQNSSHSGLYLQTSAGKAILMGTNSLEYLKNRKISEWRKKEIFGIKDLSKVAAVNITYQDKGQRTVALEQSNGKWSVKAPESLPGDQREIEDLLGKLKSLQANDVVSDAADKDAKKYGFDRPYAKFDFTINGPKGKEKKSLLVGGMIVKDKDLYVRRTDEPQVFSVRYELKDGLAKDAKKLVNRRPFSIARESVTGLKFDREAGPTELTQKDGKWRLEKPVSDAANDTKVSNLLSSVVELKAEEFLGTERPTNLGTSTKLTLVSATGSEDLTLYDRAGKDPVGNQGKLFYRFSRKAFEDVVTQIGDLRDRALRPSTEFSSITLQKGKVKARFTRTHDEKWSLGTLEGGEAALRAQLRDGAAAQKILDLTEGLSLSKFSEDAAAVDEKAEDSMTLEFQPKTGNTVSWVFGKKEGDQRYARSVQRKITGMVPASPVEEVEKILTADTKEKSKG